MNPLKTPERVTGPSNEPTQSPRQVLADDPDSLVRQEEAAMILAVTPRCLENWRHRGGGPNYVKYSARCIRYRRSDLNEWIEARVRTSTSQFDVDAS